MLVDATTELQPSRRLPPPEAWLEPERYIDISTGLALPGVEKLILPTDDRRFAMPHKAVRYVLDSLFKPEYRWAIDGRDDELKPDDHHFNYDAAKYSLEANGGDLVPSIFRELATQVGRMPRQLHNTFHDFTENPDMPDRGDMADYIEAYRMAIRMFRNVVESAKLTSRALDNFSARRLTVARGIESGRLIPSDEMDSYGEEFNKSFFNEHFQAYSEALAQLQETEFERLAVVLGDEIPNINKIRIGPKRAVVVLSKFATRESLNFVPMVLSTAA